MRPIWNGTISFGLLNIPVSLMPGERRTDLHFRMLDSRDNAPVRYERVNAETGEEVPWKEVVKAFEYDKGNYVVLQEEDFRNAAPEGREAVEIAAFVDEASIDIRHFEKPYVLVPGKKAEKGYVLLRETLRAQSQVGIARVVIRTREYLCMVKPQGDALLLVLLRYPAELVDITDYKLPEGSEREYRISKAEKDMAAKLVASMASDWDPGEYRDEFRDRLRQAIDQRLKEKGSTTRIADDDGDEEEGAATNVVDFMALLQKSLKGGQRTPAAAKAPAKKAPGKAAKKTAKAATKPATKKAAARKAPKATKKAPKRSTAPARRRAS